MATVNFTLLQCVRQQDVTGSDEPEIWIGNKRIWNGVLKKGEIARFQLEEEFEDSLEVTMREKNPNSSKVLGTVTISEDTHLTQATFKTSGAHYELFYSVEP